MPKASLRVCVHDGRRVVLDRIGLAVANFIMYYEEAGSCFRVRKSRWKIVYTPSAQTTHFVKHRTKKASPRADNWLRATGANLNSYQNFRVPCGQTCFWVAILYSSLGEGGGLEAPN